MATIRMIGEINNLEKLHTITNLFAPGDDAPEVIMDQLLEKLDGSSERNIYLWLLEITFDITATQLWWKQIEQFGIGVFPLRRDASEDQTRRFLTEVDFEGEVTKETLNILNNYFRDGCADRAQLVMPMNFLTRCLAKITFKTLNELYCARTQFSGDTWDLFFQTLQSLPLKELIEHC